VLFDLRTFRKQRSGILCHPLDVRGFMVNGVAEDKGFRHQYCSAVRRVAILVYGTGSCGDTWWADTLYSINKSRPETLYLGDLLNRQIKLFPLHFKGTLWTPLYVVFGWGWLWVFTKRLVGLLLYRFDVS
jgi:hypothetical protein